ncbi:hypothetical protein EKD04_025660 [Chloroflexales bacterium ZM16-3]|nr:hypothetical protein [Chloroflexales bacterium ZM16-3]
MNKPTSHIRITKGQKRLYISALAVLGCILCIIIISSIYAVSSRIVTTTLYTVFPRNPPPTDEELIRLLSENQTIFDEIIITTQENYTLQQARIRNTWTDPKAILTKEQWDYYKEHFAQLNIDAGIDIYRRADQISIYFNIFTSGLSVSGSSRGIVYLTSPPSDTDLVSSIDMSKLPFSYRHVEGNWYLFESSD